MASEEKESYRIFAALRDDHVVPSLTRRGYGYARKDQYEQARDDTISRISFCVDRDRHIDYCIVQVILTITYRHAAELLAEHLGKKKAGLDHASISTPLSRIALPTRVWDRGLDDPKDWRNLIPGKDPAILGPILADQLTRYAIPFFEARSSMSVVLDPSGLKPDRDDYEQQHFLKPACLWISGSHQSAIDLLKAREAQFDEDFRVRGLLRCAQFLDDVKNFRLFLEKRGKNPSP